MNGLIQISIFVGIAILLLVGVTCVSVLLASKQLKAADKKIPSVDC